MTFLYSRINSSKLLEKQYVDVSNKLNEDNNSVRFAVTTCDSWVDFGMIITYKFIQKGLCTIRMQIEPKFEKPLFRRIGLWEPNGTDWRNKNRFEKTKSKSVNCFSTTQPDFAFDLREKRVTNWYAVRMFMEFGLCCVRFYDIP